MLRDDPKYADLAKQAMKLLTIMPSRGSTCQSESRFSVLVDIKTKKRNRLGDDTFDAAMRGTLEIGESDRTKL